MHIKQQRTDREVSKFGSQTPLSNDSSYHVGAGDSTLNREDFQRQFKNAVDPNSLGDRNYPWLPEKWGEAPAPAQAK